MHAEENMMAAVIVTWNSERVIGACLDSCLRAELPEVIVVDNASTDGTLTEVKRRPGVKLIVNPTNFGFAGAVNIGVSSTDARDILLLNPDCQLLTGWRELSRALEAGKVGAACGSLVGTHGELQHGFNIRGFPSCWTLAFEALGLNRIWPSSPVNRRYRAKLAPDKATNVEQPAGAFLAFGRAVWLDLGGFDERFWPAWFEDVDFCKRVWQSGREIRYIPTARAIHLGGASVAKLSWADRERYWYANLIRYALKHYSKSGIRVTLAGVIAGLLLRTIAVSIQRLTLEPAAVYSRVVWAAFLKWFHLGNANPGQRERTFIWKGLQLRD